MTHSPLVSTEPQLLVPSHGRARFKNAPGRATVGSGSNKAAKRDDLSTESAIQATTVRRSSAPEADRSPPVAALSP